MIQQCRYALEDRLHGTGTGQVEEHPALVLFDMRRHFEGFV
jgi:hypothetical protein